MKSFVTGGPHADLLVTIAKVTDNPGAKTGTAIFPIRQDAPGVRLAREIRTLDGAPHGEFELRDVEVPAADVIGEIGEGVPRALESITALRLRAAATACGAGRWTLDYALAQARRPHRSGVPLGEREQVQAMLGQSAMDLFAARAALYAAARTAESGGDSEVEVAMAKERAELYLKSCADGIFIESPHDVAELELIGKKFDVPQMANMLEGGRTPILKPAELADMGFEIAIYGISLLMHSVHTMQGVLAKLARGDVSFIGQGVGFEEYKTIVGFDDWAKIEDRFR